MAIEAFVTSRNITAQLHLELSQTSNFASNNNKILIMAARSAIGNVCDSRIVRATKS